MYLLLLLCVCLDDKPEPCLYILDQRYTYGCEFYGAQPSLAITPLMDKSFFCMSQAIAQYKGSLMVGETGSGKSETVKVGGDVDC